MTTTPQAPLQIAAVRTKPALHDYGKKAGQVYRERKTRVFFFYVGDTALGMFSMYFPRTFKDYRPLIAGVLKAAGLPADLKARWSRHAGCGQCPCSPGFILEGAYGQNIYVDVTL